MEAVKKVYDFLDEVHNYYLATVDGNQPRVRIYGTSLLYEGKLYIMAFSQSAATFQIAANPKFEICAFKAKTLRLTGKLNLDERQEVKDAMLAKMPGLKNAVGENGKGAQMYYISDATAVFSTMTGESETVNF